MKTPELAIERIRERVSKGGHFIADEIVKRRYYRGLRNLFDLFIPLSDYWTIIDNTGNEPLVIADYKSDGILKILNTTIFNKIKEVSNAGK